MCEVTPERGGVCCSTLFSYDQTRNSSVAHLAGRTGPWSTSKQSVIGIFSPFDLGQTWEHLSACLDSVQRRGRIGPVVDSCLVPHVSRTDLADLSLSSTQLHSSGWKKTLYLQYGGESSKTERGRYKRTLGNKSVENFPRRNRTTNHVQIQKSSPKITEGSERLVEPRDRFTQSNTMAAPPAAAIKARIMQYMNTDRPETLEDYLKFYNSITPVPQSTKLVDFDLDFMKIEYTNQSGANESTIVKINPPMSSLSDSRVKFVAMAEEATGKSYHQPPDSSAAPPQSTPTTTKSNIGWTLPEWPGFISLSAICFGFWALSHSYPLSPEGPLIRVLPKFLVVFGWKFREQLFAMMIGIHVIEGIVVARKCLEQGMSIPLVLLWTINGAFEGGPAIMRIDKLIAQKAK